MTCSLVCFLFRVYKPVPMTSFKFQGLRAGIHFRQKIQAKDLK